MADIQISSEAVDKAARAYIAELRAKLGWGVEFDQLADIEKNNARETAAAMLTAAAPLIVAAELERFIPIVREICGRQNEPDYNEAFEDGWDSALTYFVARAEQLRAQS